MDAPPDCTRCPRLCASRKAVVNDYGPYEADLWIIAQGPGREEERRGRPLCGWSGSRTMFLLGHAGIETNEVHLANVTRCRTPRGKSGDLPPTKDEIRNCAPYLLDDLLRYRPSTIVAMGGPAIKWFLPEAKVSQDHGRRFEVTYDSLKARWGSDDDVDSGGVSATGSGRDSVTVVPVYHPAAATPNRNPGLARVMIEDWKRLGEIYAEELPETERSYRKVDALQLAEYLRCDSCGGKGYHVEDRGWNGAEQYMCQECGGHGTVLEIAFDFETTDPRWHGTFQPMRARMIGVSMAKTGMEAVYYVGDSIPECLKTVLEDSDVIKVAHNAVFEYIVCHTHGVHLRNFHCTKLMAYVLRRSTTYLKGLTWTELGLEQVHFDEVDWDDEDQVVAYGGADSALTYTLMPRFLLALDQEGMRDLYERERLCLPVIGDMAIRGVLLDTQPLTELTDALLAERPVLAASILDLFHVDRLPDRDGMDIVNLNSGQQLAELLYGPALPRAKVIRTLKGRDMHDQDCSGKSPDDEQGWIKCEKRCNGGVRQGARAVLRWLPPGLNWPILERTESGDPATDMNTIRLYRDQDVAGKEVIDPLVKLKSMTRLLNNELKKWPQLIHEDGRIHPTFHQSGAYEETGRSSEAPVTGRFSSSGPNFQNITHHGDDDRPYVAEWAKRLRRAIVATPDYLLLRADIGQEEPRIGAMISDDWELLWDLTHGDVYCPTAERAYGRPITKADREERQTGKRNWMAWLNGAGASGIQQAAFWLSDSDASGLVRWLQVKHPMVEITRTALVEYLHTEGYTETWFGRRIHRTEVWSGPGPARNHAERSVMPDRIQGTAADVMKIWMSKVHQPLRDIGAYLLLNVHDELVVEVPDVASVVTAAVEILRAGLSYILPIPLPLEWAVGPNWADLGVDVTVEAPGTATKLTHPEWFAIQAAGGY